MSKKIIIAREIIVPIFERTKSINQTAKELGIGWNACKRILIEYGCQSSPKNGVVDPYNLFNCINSEEDAYWLGIMYTDGWIRSDVNKIGFGSTDLELVEKWKNYTKSPNTIQVKKGKAQLGKSLPEGRTVKNAKNFYTLEFSSKRTKKNLIALGCVPKKNKILQCPTSEQVSDKFLWHFFRGCVDGDGTVRYGTRNEISLLGTQHFLEVLLTRLKILHYGSLHKKNNSDVWVFSIYKKKLVEKVLDQMYANAHIYLKRKHKPYLIYLGRSSI